MTKAGKQMIAGLKEAITMNSLMIENKMMAAELRQADDMALNQALTIKKLQEENETLREALKPCADKAIEADKPYAPDITEDYSLWRAVFAAIRESGNE